MSVYVSATPIFQLKTSQWVTTTSTLVTMALDARVAIVSMVGHIGGGSGNKLTLH